MNTDTLAQNAFPKTWEARLLPELPLIIPARGFVYPLHIPGEEAAMGRGALLLDVKPANGTNFLAQCALGFLDPSLPTGLFTCPRADDLLAIAGGYAYLVDTLAPERCLHLPLRPVTKILSAPDPDGQAGLILLAGFHNIIAIDSNGLRWQSARLSWEGVTMIEVRDGHLHGTGWNMRTDREVPFSIDLATGQHEGGGFSG